MAEVPRGAVEEAGFSTPGARQGRLAVKLRNAFSGFLDGRQRAHQQHQSQKMGKQSGRQPLEVYRRRGEVGLDRHIGETPPNRSGKTVPVLRLAMVAFRASPVTLIELFVLFRPSLTTPARPQQRRIIIAYNDRLVDAPFGQANGGKVAAGAVAGA